MSQLDLDIKNGKKWAPYAPPATVVSVIRHFRDRDVPDQIDRSRLTQAGVPDGLLNKVWSTLLYLGLIREDGTTTESLRNLRFASDEQYAEVFKGVLVETYADIFRAIGPEHADEFQLYNAFRPFSPGGQRSRMITLFLGLCQEAGLRTAVQPRERTSMASGSRRTAPRMPPKGDERVERRRDGGSGKVDSVNEATHGTPDVFSLTEQDIADLPEEEFNEVWAMLGKVIRRRSQRPGSTLPVEEEGE